MPDASLRKYRRILLQIDSTTHSRHTMGAAVELAARLGSELQGIFIEDSDLATLSDLGFVREYRFSSPVAHRLDRPTIEAQFRAMARSIQRQLEQVARQRKVSVEFRSVRRGVRGDDRDFEEVDLVIIESTSLLTSRTVPEGLAGREAPPPAPPQRRTLLLKGARRLSTDALVICDSLNAAEQGIRAVTSLLSILPENITLLPLGLNEEALVELVALARSEQESNGTKMRILPPLSVGNAHLLDRVLEREMLLVITAGGAFLEDPDNLRRVLASRHPVLFLH